MDIHIDGENAIRVNKCTTPLDSISHYVYEHITDMSDSDTSPQIYAVEIEGLGTRRVSNHEVVFRVENETHYDVYVLVQEQILIAYDKARDALAQDQFGISYEELKNEPEREADLKQIQLLLPRQIHEK